MPKIRIFQHLQSQTHNKRFDVFPGQWLAATINNHDSSDNSVDADVGYRDEPISRLVHSLAKRSIILNTIEESNLSLGRGKSQGKSWSNNCFIYQGYLISVTSFQQGKQAITKATYLMTRMKRRLSWRSSATN